jgi:hypothetical protein
MKFWWDAMGAKQVLIFVDPMQTIYGWNGASAEGIMKIRPDREIILPKSYRLPREPFEFAKRIAKRCGDHDMDGVEPSDRDGAVIHLDYQKVFNVDSNSNSNGNNGYPGNDDRTKFFLFRTNDEAERFFWDALRHRMLLCSICFSKTRDRSPPNGKLLSAFDDFYFINRYNGIVKLYHDDILTFEEVRSLISSIPAKKYLKKGIKTKIMAARKDEKFRFDYASSDFYTLFHPQIDTVEGLKSIINDPGVRISEGDYSNQERKRFLINIKPNYEPVDKINSFCGTIHASKGLEADIVYIFDWIPHPESDEKEEMRLRFVAITRTLDVAYIVLSEKGGGFIDSVAYA